MRPPAGTAMLRARRIASPFFTRTIIAGAMRGYAVCPHSHFIARSPGTAAIGLPHVPQKRWLRAQSAICSARPATARVSSSMRPHNVRSPLKT
jgi:hypothetical protein